ncbi:MAG TPA: AAA family ATPase [Pirellulales bacterium]|nr:AAA family ATPase [Pirellulales bacterium]
MPTFEARGSEIDERVATELKAAQSKLLNEGDLPSKEQLAGYYAVFRDRFGPDRLAGLDGEALLNTIHAHFNRDSLVYWLEFKNDDEFPARFGGIGGGSALKFGIYRRKETGEWMRGSPRQQVAISSAEAVEYARKHRDQILRGAELLAALPGDASDEQYRNMQEAMNRVAPDIGDTAWGHKYFSLLYPDKLDDFHNVEWHRFNLTRILQAPPEGDGRYLCAGRFVAGARQLGLPMNWFSTALNERNGRPYQYWRIGTSDGTAPRKYWPAMREGGFASIGWDELGDLSTLANGQEGIDAIKLRMAERYGGDPSAVGRQARQIYRFVKEASPQDVILAGDGAAILGVGKVTGDYYHAPGDEFPHRRPVKWLDVGEWNLPNSEGLQTAFHRLGKDTANLVAIERRMHEGTAPPPPGLVVPPVGKLVIPSLTEPIPARIQAILERKGQVILYGPPGTGKTYWAERTARELAALGNFGVPFDRLNSEQQREILGTKSETGALLRFCCFHPAYGYEDFLEGYRPQQANGELVFELRPGIFRRLCRDAAAGPNRRFYLIIDEINRGDVPRIFGELLTVLEKDKRGKSIILPLTGELFHVPSNVFLIGTMNTADRSIALLDTALRRRFGFIEIMPDSSVLGAAVVGGIPLAAWLDALNERICEHIGRDARNLQVGHSYLLEAGRSISDFATFARVLREDIIPLLEEYCYEDHESLARILGPGLIDVNRQRIRDELFDSPGDGLRDALLGPCPDLATTAAVVTALAAADDGVDETDADAGGGP